MSAVDLSIVIVNYNTAHLLAEFFAAVDAGIGALSVQIIVIDNASRDGSVQMIHQRYPQVELVENGVNVGFGRANNQALSRARGRNLLLLNTDAFVEAGGIERSVRYLEEHPECAVLGARLIGRDGTQQPSCRCFPTPWSEFVVQTGLARFFAPARLVDETVMDHSSARECDWVPGCYYLVRMAVVAELGLFDPRFFLYYEEVDHCRAVKSAGWRIMCYPQSTVVHIGGESARSDFALTAAGQQISVLQIESGLLYHRKHHGWIGLGLKVLLATLGDAMLALKALVRQKRLGAVRPYGGHAIATWSLLMKTHWATQPTR